VKNGFISFIFLDDRVTKKKQALKQHYKMSMSTFEEENKMLGIIESCVMTGEVIQKKGISIVEENLQMKKEVATANALAADWEKKFNNIVMGEKDLADLAYNDGYAVAEEKWIPLYDAVCKELDDLKKQVAPVEVPVKVVVNDLSMTESEKLAEESDTILHLVTSLSGSLKKCVNPEDEE
jgi:hypothetical protein